MGPELLGLECEAKEFGSCPIGNGELWRIPERGSDVVSPENG